MRAVAPSLAAIRSFFRTDFENAADEIESADRIPPALLQRAAELGIYRLTIPEEFDGFGLGLSELLPYLEVAAMGPGAGRMLVHVGNGIWRPIARFGNQAQRALIPRMAAGQIVVAFALTERSGGSGRDLHSVAIQDGRGWRLTGEKHLTTFADRAHYFLIPVGSDASQPHESLTAFLVPRETPGLEIDVSQPTMGLHGTGHAFLRYQDLRLSDDHRLGPIGDGLAVAFHFLHYSRISLSACMVGLAQRALEEALAFARRRVTFGKPIAERQVIQAHLADMSTDIAAARALVKEVAAAYDQGEDVAGPAATAKLFCLNMAGRVTDLALRVHGGYGYTKAAPIERIYRDARGFWFEEGTAEIQQLLIARTLLAAGTNPDQ